LFKNLRQPGERRHVRAVSRANVQCNATVLWRTDLYRRVLWRLPRPRDILHIISAMLLQ